MRLYVLNCGQMYNERAFLWHFGTQDDTGHVHEARTFRHTKSIYYIDHPEAKILFDTAWKLEDFCGQTGFPFCNGPEGWVCKQEPDENPIAQLKKIGVSVDDIDYVAMSHLMEEHAGWLPEFAGSRAQIVVQQKEYEYAHRIGMPNLPDEPPPVEQFHTWMYRREQYEVPGLNYKFINGDYELAKDVIMIHNPGHTPGYQVMLVRLPKTGTVVLSPCEHRGMYYGIPINGNAPGIPHSFTWFAAEELRSFKKIRDLVEQEKGEIFCGHDEDQFQALKHAPDYYE